MAFGHYKMTLHFSDSFRYGLTSIPGKGQHGTVTESMASGARLLRFESCTQPLYQLCGIGQGTKVSVPQGPHL